jgi:hypothetical protein
LPQAKDPIDKTVKSFPSLLVCTAKILGVGSAFNSLLAEERAFPAKFPIRQVVVVIRHGEDAKSTVAPTRMVDRMTGFQLAGKRCPITTA